MKLAIISHTPHYKNENEFYGWGPTIREINYLSQIFEEIYHLAPLHDECAPPSSQAYTSKKIKFIPLKPYGGEKLSDKFSILTTAFYNLKKVKYILNKVDWVQFRAPTAMGIYILPYLSFKKFPEKWIKYAGNWNMINPPISYRFQRWWLKNNLQNSKVTINGQWKNQSSHLLNFQNPCLDNDEIIKAVEISRKKIFGDQLIICFSGILTTDKGVDLILEALKKITDTGKIEEVIFAGDSIERKKFENLASGINIKITFRGFLNRKELEEVYTKSHLILLPSMSEGFPKVIAEAAAYGCVPIVSDISSIGLYINETNGYLLKEINTTKLVEKINEALNDRKALKNKSKNVQEIARLFTFENYIHNLKEKILFNTKS